MHALAHRLRVHAIPRPQQQSQYLHQFVLHAALDSIDDVMWNTKECHLKVYIYTLRLCNLSIRILSGHRPFQQPPSDVFRDAGLSTVHAFARWA